MNAPDRMPPPSQAASWQAELRLGFVRMPGPGGARTALSDNRHSGPLRVQKALHPEGDAVCQAIVLHPPSGIAGGDRLTIDVRVGAEAHAQLTTPGAGKWYRSAGEPAKQTLAFSVEAGATLEWLPQETIVFDGALAGMTTRIDLAAGARFIGWDILCLGRRAAGERFLNGRVDLALCIDRDGAPLWRERGGFDGGDAQLASPAGWDGATVSGTLLAAFPELPPAAPALLERCRTLAPDDAARHALTALPGPGGGLLVARYLGDNSEAARHWFAALWHEIRPAACGRAALTPRIWNT